MRIEAIRALGNIGTAATDAIPALLVVAVDKSDRRFQLEAVFALLKIGYQVTPEIDPGLWEWLEEQGERAPDLLNWFQDQGKTASGMLDQGRKYIGLGESDEADE